MTDEQLAELEALVAGGMAWTNSVQQKLAQAVPVLIAEVRQLRSDLAACRELERGLREAFIAVRTLAAETDLKQLIEQPAPLDEIVPRVAVIDDGTTFCEWIAGKQGSGEQVRFGLSVDVGGSFEWMFIGWNFGGSGYVPDAIRAALTQNAGHSDETTDTLDAGNCVQNDDATTAGRAQAQAGGEDA